MSDCKTCDHPQRKEIERQARAGVPASTLAAWTRDTEGGYVSRLALGNHLRKHATLTPAKGRRPVAGRLLEAMVEAGEERLEAGEVEVTLKEALLAQKALWARENQNLDRDLWTKVTIAMTGGIRRTVPRIVDPEIAIIEARYRVLADGGDLSAADAAEAEARRRLIQATLTTSD